jgi:hypothetical protein
MHVRWTLLVPLCLGWQSLAAVVPVDVSGVRPGGAVTVETTPASVKVHWNDNASRPWTAEFSLDPAKPIITAISVGGKLIVDRAQPYYQCQTGKRRGGWDEFFDFPPSHPDGTRSFLGEFHLKSARATTIGDRLDIAFDGMKMGIFEGSLHYLFFPGSRLIEQVAVLSTQEPDTAYFYDTGLRMTVEADRRSGGNMDTHVTYVDTTGALRTLASSGSERRPLAVRYRALAAKLGQGTVAVFPTPHQYFFPRDYTTNLGYVWHTAWRGNVSLGIRQLPDDYAPFYPWSNAPPGTQQRMSMFLLLDDGEPARLLEDVRRYTHNDTYVKLPGYKTFEPHWHLAYTVQAMDHGFDWTPPFKPVMKDMGIDSAMIMEFHGDGHPQDHTEVRLRELEALYRACRSQSGSDFLLIPAEEANVHLGGHWALVFPKPVYWYMSRQDGEPVHGTDPKSGPFYRIGNAQELLEMVRAEGGYMYQTHPRTKGSKGYPDKIRDTAHFMDPRYLGAGWKALPSDLSSPRLGERAFKLLDDMNNWGLKKRLMGEVDVFQIDSTHELYAHMNINYVRLPSLPSFDNYGRLLDAVGRGEYFVTTGEVLLPATSISAGAGDKIVARATVNYSFPLEMAEVVWGDGQRTERKIFPLDETREFQQREFTWDVDAPNWKWARLAVWDAAGNGAFINPVWRGDAGKAVASAARTVR